MHIFWICLLLNALYVWGWKMLSISDKYFKIKSAIKQIKKSTIFVVIVTFIKKSKINWIFKFKSTVCFNR